MDDLFFADDSMQDNSYESLLPDMRLNVHRLPFIESLNNQLGITLLSDFIFEKERPIKMQSALYQSKTSVLSSAKKSDYDENQEFMPYKDDDNVFYSDQSDCQFPLQNCHQFGVKSYSQVQYPKDNQISSGKSPKAEGSSQQNFKSKKVQQRKYKKQQKKQPTPKIATRNMLQYFWKVLKNYFTGKKQSHSRNRDEMKKMRLIWEQMGHLKPSLPSFTRLFNNDKMRPYLKEIFKSRYLMRQIVSSSQKESTKATYLRYVKVLLKGFLCKDLQFLN